MTPYDPPKESQPLHPVEIRTPSVSAARHAVHTLFPPWFYLHNTSTLSFRIPSTSYLLPSRHADSASRQRGYAANFPHRNSPLEERKEKGRGLTTRKGPRYGLSDGLDARDWKAMAMVKMRPGSEWRWYELRSSDADNGYITSSRGELLSSWWPRHAVQSPRPGGLADRISVMNLMGQRQMQARARQDTVRQ